MEVKRRALDEHDAPRAAKRDGREPFGPPAAALDAAFESQLKAVEFVAARKFVSGKVNLSYVVSITGKIDEGDPVLADVDQRVLVVEAVPAKQVELHSAGLGAGVAALPNAPLHPESRALKIVEH